MKISVDTNVLVRAVVGDDMEQARLASKWMKEAELIAISLPCLCEFVWVLRRVYGFGRKEISSAISALMESANVVMNRQAVEVGLTIFEAGGDFADGLIAYEGNWLGGETFVSFDKEAVKLSARFGYPSQLLGSK